MPIRKRTRAGINLWIPETLPHPQSYSYSFSVPLDSLFFLSILVLAFNAIVW